MKRSSEFGRELESGPGLFGDVWWMRSLDMDLTTTILKWGHRWRVARTSNGSRSNAIDRRSMLRKTSITHTSKTWIRHSSL